MRRRRRRSSWVSNIQEAVQCGEGDDEPAKPQVDLAKQSGRLRPPVLQMMLDAQAELAEDKSNDDVADDLVVVFEAP